MSSLQLTERLSSCAGTIPNRIRYYRLQAGLSQAHLGQLVGHGRSVISSWERGRSYPTVPNLLHLAKALDTLGEALYQGLYCNDRPSDAEKELKS
jgi:transcriptional regulator with XRE-family HTH domain